MAKRTAKPRLPDDSEVSHARMGFGDHLNELRKRLIYSAYGSVGFVVLCLYFSHQIVYFLLRPYILALTSHGYPPVFDYDKPASVVISYLSLGVKAGLVLASPWIIYQLWLFVAAGLFQRERKLVYKFVGPSLFLFLMGVAFFYFLVLPLTLNFFIGFTDNTAIKTPQPTWLEQKLGLNPVTGGVTTMPTTSPAEPAGLIPIPVLPTDPPKPPDGYGYVYFKDGAIKFRIGDLITTPLVAHEGSLFNNVPQFDEYLSFISWTAVIFGLAFEMPMVILVIAKIGLVKVKTFREIRKYAYFVIAVISCIAAPSTDILTMLCLMFPLIGLYEVGVIAAAIATRKSAVEETSD